MREATKVLIFGASGMLGSDLVGTAPAGVVVIPLGKGDADVTDRAQVARAIHDVEPDWVINATAYSGVDDAEKAWDSAKAVNGDAPGLIGTECAERRIRVVHFSTDYVFRGDAREPYAEDAPLCPVNAYGRSKLLGERTLAASGAEALIVRTQWLFGRAGRSFPRTMWHRATHGQHTCVVNDQIGRATYSIDLACATWRLMSLGACGVYHVTNGGQATTWFGIAQQVFARAGGAALLSACTSEQYPTLARRPVYSALDTTKAEALLGQPLPDWKDALERFLTIIGGARHE